MPFIRISSIRIYTGEVTYLSAGENRVSTCRNIDTLKAKVIGDLHNHSIEWVQTAGQPVTWLTDRNQLEVSYSQTVKDDKTFRFYIDRGSPEEMYDDVQVWQTPTEIHYMSAAKTTHQSAHISYTDATLDNGKFYVVAEWGVHPDFQQLEDVPGTEISYSDGSMNKALFWTLGTGELDRITHFVVQRKIGFDWVDFALVPGDRYYAPIENGYLYRVQTFFKFEQLGNRYYWVASDPIEIDERPHWWAWESVNMPSGQQVGSGSSHITTDYGVLKRYLVRFEPDWDETNANFKHTPKAHTVTDFEVLQRYVTRLDPAPSSTYEGCGATHKSIYQTSTYQSIDLTSIGGTAIGG